MRNNSIMGIPATNSFQIDLYSSEDEDEDENENKKFKIVFNSLIHFLRYRKNICLELDSGQKKKYQMQLKHLTLSDE